MFVFQNCIGPFPFPSLFFLSIALLHDDRICSLTRLKASCLTPSRCQKICGQRSVGRDVAHDDLARHRWRLFAQSPGCKFLSAGRAFASWQDWQASCVTSCLEVGLTANYKKACDTAVIFITSTLNASAVISDIFEVSASPATQCLSFTRDHLTSGGTLLTHARGGHVSRVRQTRHWLASGLMGRRGTNERIPEHYHLEQRTSCRHPNLFSGIYNFRRPEVQVWHGVYRAGDFGALISRRRTRTIVHDTLLSISQ